MKSPFSGIYLMFILNRKHQIFQDLAQCVKNINKVNILFTLLYSPFCALPPYSHNESFNVNLGENGTASE